MIAVNDGTARILDLNSGREKWRSRHLGSVREADFSPGPAAAYAVGLFGLAGEARFYPRYEEDSPSWLSADLLSSQSGHRFVNGVYGEIQPALVEEMIERLHRELRAYDERERSSGADLGYHQLLSWFLSNPEHRAISPGSDRLLHVVAAEYAMVGSEDAVEAAYRSAPWHPLMPFGLARHEEDLPRAAFLRRAGVAHLLSFDGSSFGEEGLAEYCRYAAGQLLEAGEVELARFVVSKADRLVPQSPANSIIWGRIAQRTGESQDAVDHFQEAIEKALSGSSGVVPIHVLHWKGELAEKLIANDQPDSAEQLYGELVDQWLMSTEREPDHVVDLVRRWTHLQFAGGRSADAEATLKTTIEKLQLAPGDVEELRISLLILLSGLYEATNNSAAFFATREEVLQRISARHGAKSGAALGYANDLATALLLAGRLERAEILLRYVLEGREESLGTKHPETLSSLNNMGSLLAEKGDDESAILYYRKSLEWRIERLGKSHPDTCKSAYNLARSLMRRGRIEKAMEYARLAHEGARSRLGADDPFTVMTGSLLHELDIAGAGT